MKLISKRMAIILAVAAAHSACSDKEEEEEPDPRAIEPDYYCPGSSTCRGDGGDSVLMAGAAMATINPTIVDTIDDVDEDGYFEPPPMGDDVWHDNNENGQWDFTWIAGYDYARPANDIHDDLWARTVVLQWESTTIAIVALDLAGIFLDDVMDIRDQVSDLEIDYVVVHATHDHEAPDVIGYWGFDETWPGWDAGYSAMVVDTAGQTIREAYAGMVPAKVAYGTAVPDDHPERGLCNVALDGRDPFILIETITTIRFVDAADESTIAVLINWAGHPESASDKNHSISSDYPHYLRRGVESGIHRGSTDLEGVGGIAMFMDGAFGSQIGHPLAVTCEDLEGETWEPTSWDDFKPEFGKVQCIGENLAVAVLRAIENETEPADECPLAFRVLRFEVTVENYGFHALILNDVLNIHSREVRYDRTKFMTGDNLPKFDTEISWLRIGESQAINVPGELTPELAVGGYDGSRTPECAYGQGIDRDLLSYPDNPNKPDLAQAPGPPYLFDFLDDLA